MTQTQTPAAIADQAAEAIRSLNHLTRREAAGLTYPSDVYDVLGGLATMAARLPQLAQQLASWLEREHQAGRVGQDGSLSPGEYVAAVVEALGRAAGDAVALQGALDTAYHAAGALTGTDA